MKEYKIIITGPMGAGKTTAIRTISEIEPIVTDVLNNDNSIEKETTTVGFDYGEISLSNNERLRLYGTPGQERFDFMWKVLAQGALGLIIFIDMSRPDPLEDLDLYVSNFKGLIQQTGCVIGLSKVDACAIETTDPFSDLLHSYQLICPIVPVDVREKSQVLWVLDLLITQLEAKA